MSETGIDPKVINAAYTRLEERLYKWLFDQAEWPLVLSAPRNVRKTYAHQLADIVTRIPTFVTHKPEPIKPLAVKRLEVPHDVALD